MSVTDRAILPRSSSKMRSVAIFAARRSPSSGRSLAPTPRRTTSPLSMLPTVSASTSTRAERTRWMTALRCGLLQHPRVVAADHVLDLFRGEVAGRPHDHALGQRHPRDVRDLAEAVAVLEEELLAVDLDELSTIGRDGGRHALSMRARAGRVLSRYQGQPPHPGSP